MGNVLILLALGVAVLIVAYVVTALSAPELLATMGLRVPTARGLVSTVSTAGAQPKAERPAPIAQPANVLSSYERPARRSLKRTTLAEIRAQYGYTVRV